MIKPVPGILSCVDDQTCPRSRVLGGTLDVLVATAGLGVLVLLFAFAAALSLWSCLASVWEPSDLGARLSRRIASWRRVATLFTLGLKASWNVPVVGPRPAPILNPEMES